jgi:HAD superfamily hydrolase (TIGR01509 family)
MRPPGAVFLDFDGLVCETERAALKSWVDCYARYGLEFPATLWASMAGRSNGEQIARADLGHRLGRPLSDDEVTWRRRRKQVLADREPLRPGVAELVAAASQRHIPVAVVSSSSRDWVAGHLARTGLLGRLSFLVTGDDEKHHKPAPDLYLAALRRAGVRPGDAVAFEDSLTGLRAARAAGLWCVLVPSAATWPTWLPGADVTLASIGQFHLASAVPEGRDVT